MTAISAPTGLSSSLQAGMLRTRVAQARIEADQAEAYAQSLRAQADAAQLDAEKSQSRLRELNSQSVLNLQGQTTGRIVNVRA